MRLTRSGTDIGYRVAGDVGGRGGEKSNECRKESSDERTEETRVPVNLKIASSVKTDNGGGSKLSEEDREDFTNCKRCSDCENNLHRSAD